MSQFPATFQPILWSKSLDELDIKLDKVYIINQVLMYGSLEQIKTLGSLYSPAEIREVFLNHPLKIYNRVAINFLKKFILNIPNDIDQSQYLAGSPRITRP